MNLTILDGAIIGIPIGICLAVLVFGAIFRPPHCDVCEHGDVRLPDGLHRTDPLVRDVLASEVRPCAKARSLRHVAGLREAGERR